LHDEFVAVALEVLVDLRAGVDGAVFGLDTERDVVVGGQGVDK